MPVAKRKASSKSSGKAKGAKRTKPNGSSSGQKKSKQKQNGAAGGEKRERGPPTFVVGPSSALEEADEDEAMMEEEDDILQDGANTFLNGLDLKQISRYADCYSCVLQYLCMYRHQIKKIHQSRMEKGKASLTERTLQDDLDHERCPLRHWSSHEGRRASRRRTHD